MEIKSSLGEKHGKYLYLYGGSTISGRGNMASTSMDVVPSLGEKYGRYLYLYGGSTISGREIWQVLVWM